MSTDFHRICPTLSGDFNPQQLPSRGLQTLWEWKNRVLLGEHHISSVAVPLEATRRPAQILNGGRGVQQDPGKNQLLRLNGSFKERPHHRFEEKAPRGSPTPSLRIDSVRMPRATQPPSSTFSESPRSLLDSITLLSFHL